jgi:chaperone modulatory protein CbpM
MTMFSAQAVVESIAGLDADDLDRWVAVGWVQPGGGGESALFDVVDVARVRLIFELHAELHIESDSVPIVLSLLDQLYATRRMLRDVLAAVDQQAPDVRADITLRMTQNRQPPP